MKYTHSKLLLIILFLFFFIAPLSSSVYAQNNKIYVYDLEKERDAERDAVDVYDNGQKHDLSVFVITLQGILNRNSPTLFICFRKHNKGTKF